MGQAARDVLLRTTTPGQRLDLGIKLAEAMMNAVLARACIPADLPPEERARRGFWALREAGKR